MSELFIVKIIMVISISWIAPFMAHMQKKLAVNKNGLLLGITFQKSAEGDGEVERLVSDYVKANRVTNRALIAAFLLLFLVKDTMWFVGLSMLWLDAVIAAFMIVQAVYYKRLRAVKEERYSRSIVDENGEAYDDGDAHWIIGSFYFNKDDSHIMVNDRYGMGQTINIAKPIGKVLILISLILCISLPFFPALVSSAVDEEVKVVIGTESLQVSSGSEEWLVEYSDIEGAELLWEYPEKLRRTWGTATDHILKGTFSSADYNPIRVCLNQNETPYLLIRAQGKRFYLFGISEDGVIQAAYNAIRQYGAGY